MNHSLYSSHRTAELHRTASRQHNSQTNHVRIISHSDTPECGIKQPWPLHLRLPFAGKFPHGLSSMTIIHVPGYDQNFGGKRLKMMQENGGNHILPWRMTTQMISVQDAMNSILASLISVSPSARCGCDKTTSDSTIFAKCGMKHLRFQGISPRSSLPDIPELVGLFPQ